MWRPCITSKYWQNEEALGCILCAAVLALDGLNVDRGFLVERGPGGIGRIPMSQLWQRPLLWSIPDTKTAEKNGRSLTRGNSETHRQIHVFRLECVA